MTCSVLDMRWWRRTIGRRRLGAARCCVRNTPDNVFLTFLARQGVEKLYTVFLGFGGRYNADRLYHTASRCGSVTILYAAHFQAVRDFTIQPILSTTPPLIFTMLVILTAVQATKIGAVSDTTIVG